MHFLAANAPASAKALVLVQVQVLMLVLVLVLVLGGGAYAMSMSSWCIGRQGQSCSGVLRRVEDLRRRAVCNFRLRQ